MKQKQRTLIEFERLYQNDKNIDKNDFGDIENFILKNSDENATFLKIGSVSG